MNLKTSGIFCVVLVLLIAVFGDIASAQTQTQTESQPTASANPNVNSDGKPAESHEPLSIPYSVRLDSTPSRFSMSATGNMAQFSLAGRSLEGNTLEMSAGYALTSSIKSSLAVDQAVTLEDGISVMYTGLRTYFSYALIGSFYESSSVLYVNGKPSLGVEMRSPSNLSVDLGLDQYIFNGTTSITPATGVSTALRYERDLFGLRALAVARYGMLLIANQSGSLMSAGLGLAYRF